MKRPVAFGLNVDPNTDGLPIAARIAAIADTSGLEYAGIQDHPYNPDFVDTLTQITWLAAHTSRVHLFPNVADLPLRPPTMLAKQAATIDVLSSGRFELGLGAGAFHDGIAGLGGPRRTTGQARQALGEAIDVIRASWAGQPYSYEGEYYQVPHAEPGPRPAHDIGIWLGVTGPRAARLLGAKADGWSVSAIYVPPERARELGEIITDSAGEAGRDPGADRPAVQPHGLDHAGQPGPAQRAGRAVDRHRRHAVHRRRHEHVRHLAERRPGAPVPHLRRGDRPRRARGALVLSPGGGANYPLSVVPPGNTICR
jgi:alkanesulfonate monooxygenase SsuD/methylene tetrahydromethanopterin reductase-like flavin-dependent oxidoreductase (luciferase family)